MTVAVNPYRTLARQVRALLQVEALFPPESKKAYQWYLLVRFANTQVSVGKGDVNTCFLTLGDPGKDGAPRTVCYPHVLLDSLDRLARQPYPAYAVRSASGQSKRFHDLREALRVKPRAGFAIYGVPAEAGQKPARTHVARPSSVGEVRWIPTKQ